MSESVSGQDEANIVSLLAPYHPPRKSSRTIETHKRTWGRYPTILTEHAGQ